MNLIGISNTDLKKSYGPANLELLSIYDQNYSRYIRTLQLMAECIYEEYPDKAAAILEYCISIGTDISGTYYLPYICRWLREQFVKFHATPESFIYTNIMSTLNQQHQI